MKLKKVLRFEELPYDLRMALLQYLGRHAEGSGTLAIEAITVIGKRVPTQDASSHTPAEDATGYPGDPDPDWAGATR